VLSTAPAIGTAKCISYMAGTLGANTDTYTQIKVYRISKL